MRARMTANRVKMTTNSSTRTPGKLKGKRRSPGRPAPGPVRAMAKAAQPRRGVAGAGEPRVKGPGRDDNNSENGSQVCAPSPFIREHLRNLAPYTPILPFEVLSAQLGRTPAEIVKLDANENPYGPPGEVVDALSSIQFPHIYPDPECRNLRAMLSEETGVAPEQIIVGCGADELIDLLMRCCLEPGDTIIDCPPTFTMYAFDAAVNAAKVVKVARIADSSSPSSPSGGAEFAIDIDAVESAAREHGAKMLFLTSPNNPDGSEVSDETLLAALAIPGLLVVLDEAYIEFSSSPSRIEWVDTHDNLVVLRTFSKRAALAGLRVGYGAFPRNISEYLWRAKQPYNVSVAAEVAACAALRNKAYLTDVRDRLVQERERMASKLKSYSPMMEAFESQANFILCRIHSPWTAKTLRDDLASRGVMVRYYDKAELSGYVRISVGRPEHTDALVRALDEIAETRR